MIPSNVMTRSHAKNLAKQAKELANQKEINAKDARAVSREVEALTKDRKVTPELQSQYNISKRRTRISPRNPLNEFLLFPKLPLELRLMVWTLAAPEAATVAQRKSRVKGRGWRYLRPDGVPALLHTCKESRYEYLETETDDKEAKSEIESRRRKHPIYKLCFRDEDPKSAGAYMSMDIDTFWVKCFRPELANSLKHLVATYADFNTMAAPVWRFDSLESLTILVEEEILLERAPAPAPIEYPPEVDGQFTELDQVLDSALMVVITGKMALVAIAMQIFGMYNSKVQSLSVKWRHERQFIRAENLDIPEIEQDPEAAKASSATELRLRR
ncbi:hypothetical protein BDZ45DRAFT_476494 [Acephala macrosclerotiorum]|nr:hypothetical protein BDZ45DRAFT_476494 [Acephala macrosclerotiorum]